MKCSAARELIGRIGSGQAAPKEQWHLTAHLDGCATCAACWREWRTLLMRLEQSPPAVVTTERDLVTPALRAHADRRLSGAGTPAFRPLRVAAAVAMVLLLGGGGLTVWRGGKARRNEPNRLLDAVEAAMLPKRTHAVRTIYGAGGTVVRRVEEWHAPNGDGYYQVLDFDQEALRVTGAQEPTYSCGWSRPRQRVSWTYSPAKRTYYLDWADGSMSQNLMPGLFYTSNPEAIVRWWRQMSGRLAVTERTATLEGKRAKVVKTVGTLPGPNDHMPPVAIDSYLSPDGSRLLRQTTSLLGPSSGFTIDTYPIEYDTVSPASLFELKLPAGARVVFENRQIDPVWETMPETEKQQVTAAVEGLADGWRTGDFDGFSKYYDFAAGLQYGVKGKWTAEQLRELWRGLVQEQPSRWRGDALTVDYVVGTAEPPAMALQFWSIYTKMGSEQPRHVYRDKPSTEPGLLVLAREQVTDQRGNKQELRTRLFMKKIGGQYKVILWSPPFGP